ncbi:MAG TPA: TRAP transporter small permease [Dehalococcoidales bacterium]|nr:TRAP transporter small permease [Dehalococcoidales bacterium]
MISGIIIMVLCLYTTGDVIGRYILNKPLWAAYELSLIFLIYITFWGIAYVQSRGGHMRLGFLWQQCGPRGRAALDLLTVLIGIFIFAIVTWQGWLWAIDSWVIKEETMGAWTVLLFPARFGLAIGATMLLLQYIIDLLRHVGQLLTGSQVGAD